MSGSIFGDTGVSMGQAGALLQEPLPSQRWTGQRCFSVASTAIASNTLYAGPFIPTETMAADRVAIRVATGSVGSAKIGIYTALPTLLPGVLVAEITEDLDTVAAATLAGSFSANPQLVVGQLYWLATCFSATPTMSCWNHATAQNGGFIWPIGSAVAESFFITSRAPSRVTRTAELVYVPATQFFPLSFGAATEGSGTPGAPLVALRKL